MYEKVAAMLKQLYEKLLDEAGYMFMTSIIYNKDLEELSKIALIPFPQEKAIDERNFRELYNFFSRFSAKLKKVRVDDKRFMHNLEIVKDYMSQVSDGLGKVEQGQKLAAKLNEETLFLVLDKIKTNFSELKELYQGLQEKTNSNYKFKKFNELFDVFEKLLSNGLLDPKYKNVVQLINKYGSVDENGPETEEPEPEPETRGTDIGFDLYFKRVIASVNDRFKNVKDFENFIDQSNSNFLKTTFSYLEECIVDYIDIYGENVTDESIEAKAVEYDGSEDKIDGKMLALSFAGEDIALIENYIASNADRLLSEIDYVKHNINEIIEQDNSYLARKILIPNLICKLNAYENSFKEDVEGGYKKDPVLGTKRLVEAYLKLISIEDEVDKTKPSLYNPEVGGFPSKS